MVVSVTAVWMFAYFGLFLTQAAANRHSRRRRALYEASFNLHTTLLHHWVVPPLRQNLSNLSEHNIIPHGCSQLLLDVVLTPRTKQELRLHYQPKLSMLRHICAPQIRVHTSTPVSDTAAYWVLDPGLKLG